MSLRVAVLLSGSGTTLQNILDRIDAGSLDAGVCCVLSSRAGVYGLERARAHGIEAVTVARKEFGDADSFNDALWGELRKFEPELIVLAGFMSLLRVPSDFVNRIINVHPALIPAFSGEGMWGHHVHEAVLAHGVKLTGATVHFVNAVYDEGAIILQDTVPVLEGDTPDTLAERVQAKERELYPRAIQLIAEGRVSVDGRIVHIRDADAG
jgi:phosphoribosylglycinamide formyltransferase-1